MLEIRKTNVFAKWVDALCDVNARARILVRVERLAAGNPGNVKPVGEGVSELRIDYGPGYRVYYKQRGQVMCKWHECRGGYKQQGQEVVVLLAGGDKRTQASDIKTALRLARNL